MNTARWLAILSFTAVSMLVVSAHQSSLSGTPASSTYVGPGNCEDNSSFLTVLAQTTSRDELVIVIAHLGHEENRKNLNDRRLHNVKIFLTEFLNDQSVRHDPTAIVLAHGDRVTGYGRVDFYIRGKLYHSLNIRRNADLAVGNCGSAPPDNPCPPIVRNLYPCRDKYINRP